MAEQSARHPHAGQQLLAAEDAATQRARPPQPGAAKWGLREEAKKFDSLLRGEGTKSRKPNAATNQHQRRFSWPILQPDEQGTAWDRPASEWEVSVTKDRTSARQRNCAEENKIVTEMRQE